MKTKEISYRYIFFMLILVSLNSCKKSDFLSASPNTSLNVPKSLEDYQLLLDNATVMNGFSGQGLTPGLGEVSADDYYLYPAFESEGYEDPHFRNLYSWNDNIYEYNNGTAVTHWSFPYRCILYSNIILDGLNDITIAKDKSDTFNTVKGSALFYRAHMFYHLAQVYAPIFDQSTSNIDLGIILKLKGDINNQPGRASVEQTYSRIITDLNEALSLLPNLPIGGASTRPSKRAVFGLLARVYLSMSDYPNSLKNANSCLELDNTLMDYNNTSSGFYPFKNTNSEIIFFSTMETNDTILDRYISRVDSNLYASYEQNDLRKQKYFEDARLFWGLSNDNGFFFKGSYSGDASLFSGIATDEVFLIRAECYAREGKVAEAMNDLNTLMRKRWNNKVPFPIFTASDKDDALKKILIERRKELIFRGIRWADLRRFNKAGANISITRNIGNQTYILGSNDLHYTFLIPPSVMDFNPGMKQNPR